jgi:hypothetical protein
MGCVCCTTENSGPQVEPNLEASNKPSSQIGRSNSIQGKSSRKLDILNDEIDHREKEDILLFISVRGLQDIKINGISDPICVVHEYNSKTDEWEYIA